MYLQFVYQGVFKIWIWKMISPRRFSLCGEHCGTKQTSRLTTLFKVSRTGHSGSVAKADHLGLFLHWFFFPNRPSGITVRGLRLLRRWDTSEIGTWHIFMWRSSSDAFDYCLAFTCKSIFSQIHAGWGKICEKEIFFTKQMFSFKFRVFVFSFHDG